MEKKLKFGIAGPVPGESVTNLINYTMLYERGDFDTVWFPDHVVFMAKNDRVSEVRRQALLFSYTC